MDLFQSLVTSQKDTGFYSFAFRTVLHMGHAELTISCHDLLLEIFQLRWGPRSIFLHKTKVCYCPLNYSNCDSVHDFDM